MTIEQAPSTNGRTASEQTYPPPAAPSRRTTVEHRRPSPRRPGLLRLVMPILFAVAVGVVLRGLTENAETRDTGAEATN
jgi:hypothetical protein